MFTKLRNKILSSFGGKSEITGLNTGSEWEKASYDTILFHWIMKNPLRKIVQMIPGIPQSWLDNLQGSPKVLYQIVKTSWYDCDQSEQRRDKMWKPFCYALVLWNNDEMMEFADRLLYETLSHPDRFYIQLGRLNPGYWYMDSNPKLPDGGQGRLVNIFGDDPAVRFDTIHSTEALVLVERPARCFVCRWTVNMEPEYVLINRYSYERTGDGGYQYQIVGVTGDLMEATKRAQELENGGN